MQRGGLHTLRTVIDTNVAKIQYPEHQLATLGEAAREVGEICRRLKTGYIPKQPARDASRAADELGRACYRIEVNKADECILAMDYQIRSLREFLTIGRAPREQWTVSTVSSLLSDAVYNIQPFATSRNVEIRRFDQQTDVEIFGDQRSLTRCFSNLLHNAVKYSWHREGGAWVTVRTKCENDDIHIEFENHGVPITKEELDHGDVFYLGYRGLLSGDRGRLGTGVGLADARDTAREHKGDVTITSRPAHSTYNGDIYETPFLTKAAVRLPIRAPDGDADEHSSSVD